MVRDTTSSNTTLPIGQVFKSWRNIVVQTHSALACPISRTSLSLGDL